jgi:hypothetical protein
MYFLDIIYGLFWWSRHIWIGILIIGLISWLQGCFREKPLKTGLVGFNRDGFPIYCEIINVGEHDIPVYYTHDWRGVQRYNIDEKWNIVHNSLFLY